MRLDALVFAIAAFGITFSVVVSHAQSTLYYVFVVVFFIPLILPGHFRTAFTPAAFILALIPMIFFFFQVVADETGRVSFFDMQRQISLSVILFIACWLARVDDTTRRQFFGLAAFAHGVLAFIAYWSWSPSEDWHRLSAFGVGTAPMAEFALAAILAAICSGNRRLVLLCTALAAPTLFGTQMRSAFVAAAIALVIFFYPAFRNRAVWARLLLVAGAVLGGAVFFTVMLDFVRELLLLDDPHRGLDSGFSGRFNSWRIGFEVFLDNFLVGVGVGHPLAKHAHNAFLIVAAEQGIFALLMMVGGVAAALLYAVRQRDYVAMAVINGWLFYLLTSPRYISFSFGIFLGWIIVLRQFWLMGEARRTRQSARPRPRLDPFEASETPKDLSPVDPVNPHR